MPECFLCRYGTAESMGRSSIPCREETHERVKALKRGGETWDSLLNKMADQYDPEETHA